MEIIINNLQFDFNIGCKILKLKYDECPVHMEKIIGDMWDDIEPITFREVAENIKNIEQRRVAFGAMGIDRIVKQVKPILVKKDIIKKETTWINKDGKLETVEFDDTYCLYRVKASVLFGDDGRTGWGSPKDVCYVKFKDTSTDREYFIWVDAESVYKTNGGRNQDWFSSNEDYISKITPIQAIAWTIQTDVEEGNIKKIVRQGDCILIKRKDNSNPHSQRRHLTEQEYRKFLVLES